MTKRFIKGYHTIRDTNENKTYDFRVDIICDLLNELDGKWVGEFSLRETLQQELQRVEEENEQLKSTIAQLIEQNRKNNDLLLYDIRILEKALWCGGCENDYGRLKELRKEFIR